MYSGDLSMNGMHRYKCSHFLIPSPSSLASPHVGEKNCSRCYPLPQELHCRCFEVSTRDQQLNHTCHQNHQDCLIMIFLMASLIHPPAAYYCPSLLFMYQLIGIPDLEVVSMHHSLQTCQLC